MLPQEQGEACRITISRATFEDFTEIYIDTTIRIIDEMLSQKQLSMTADIDEIWLTGGAAQMPQIRGRLEREYNVPIVQYMPVNIFAMGAALGGTNSYNPIREIGEKQ